jgi:hypothetical protein
MREPLYPPRGLSRTEAALFQKIVQYSRTPDPKLIRSRIARTV